MNDLFSNNAVIFAEGMLGGILLTVLWTKFARSSNAKVNSSEGEIVYDQAPGTMYAANKLVLAVRNDLKMGKGKVAAQCSHAAVLAHELCRKKCPEVFADWKRKGQPKIILKIHSEKEMLDLAEKAKESQLLVCIVQDAGRTQVAPDTRTVLAIGPGPESLINQVTGHLNLY